MKVFIMTAVPLSIWLLSCGAETINQRSISPSDEISSPEAMGFSETEIRETSFSFRGGSNPLPNETCSQRTVLHALDIDGDGVVKAETDGKLIFALMSPGTPEATKNRYKRKGKRVDFDVYFETVLRPHLDSNHDGKLNPYVDGVNVLRLMKLKNKTADNILDLSNSNTDGFVLQVLNDLRITCNRSDTPFIVKGLGLRASGNFFTNWGGKGNQWFWSSTTRSWLFLNTNRELKRWTGTQDGAAIGRTLAYLDKFYTTNPAALFNVALPAPF